MKYGTKAILILFALAPSLAMATLQQDIEAAIAKGLVKVPQGSSGNFFQMGMGFPQPDVYNYAGAQKFLRGLTPIVNPLGETNPDRAAVGDNLQQYENRNQSIFKADPQLNSFINPAVPGVANDNSTASDASSPSLTSIRDAFVAAARSQGDAFAAKADAQTQTEQAQRDMAMRQQMQQQQAMMNRGGQGAGGGSGGGSGSGSGSGSGDDSHPSDSKSQSTDSSGNPLDKLFGQNGKEPDASAAFKSANDNGDGTSTDGSTTPSTDSASSSNDLSNLVNPSSMSANSKGAFNPPPLSLPFGPANTPKTLAFATGDRSPSSMGFGPNSGVPKVGGSPSAGGNATAGDAYPDTGKVKNPPSVAENFEQASIFGGGGSDGVAAAGGPGGGNGEEEGDGAAKEDSASFGPQGLERQLASSRETTEGGEPGIFRYRGIVCSDDLKHTVGLCGHLRHHPKGGPGVTAQKSFGEPQV